MNIINYITQDLTYRVCFVVEDEEIKLLSVRTMDGQLCPEKHAEALNWLRRIRCTA